MRMRSHNLQDQTRRGALFNRRATSSRAVLYAQSRPGSLFKRRAERPSAVAQSGEIDLTLASGAGGARGKQWLAFAGVYLFTLMLYARPNDLFPALGDFPLVKIVAIGVLLIYIGSKAGARLSVWTLEMTMLMVIATLALLFMPVAASPKDSLDTLSDTFIKTVLIFILMVNLIDTRQRIFSLWKLVVICGAAPGLGAIKSYLMGEITMRGLRIEGMVGGMYGNPNDLATAPHLLLPSAACLTVSGRVRVRLFCLGCTAVMAIGVLVTVSRGGFLGLIALGGVLLWKLGRGRRLKTTLAAALLCGILLMAMPGGYGNRLSTVI